MPDISARRLGSKSMAVNLSDVAAMSAEPVCALVSIGLTSTVEVDFLDELYEGMIDMAERHGCQLVGGDTVRSPSGLVIDVFVLAEGKKDGLTLRSGARPGDVLLVTGSLGDSAAGLDVLLDRRAGGGASGAVSASSAKRVLAAHLTPEPRLPESKAIALAGGATAMMDISDGLANEVNHIASRSGVSITVFRDAIPISGAARETAAAMGKDPLSYALYGGEDYELVFTAPPGRVKEIIRSVENSTGTRVTEIGVVGQGEGCRLAWDGGSEVLRARAFDHFVSGEVSR